MAEKSFLDIFIFPLISLKYRIIFNKGRHKASPYFSPYNMNLFHLDFKQSLSIILKMLVITFIDLCSASHTVDTGIIAFGFVFTAAHNT